MTKYHVGFLARRTIAPEAKKLRLSAGFWVGSTEASDFFYVKKLKSCKAAPLSDAQLRTKRSYDEVFGNTKKAFV